MPDYIALTETPDKKHHLHHISAADFHAAIDIALKLATEQSTRVVSITEKIDDDET